MGGVRPKYGELTTILLREAFKKLGESLIAPQCTGESNATSAALAPNVACHKCLARESNP